jgi:hypothetical protein
LVCQISAKVLLFLEKTIYYFIFFRNGYAPLPPPPSQPMFHVMIGGAQQGTFGVAQLQQMAQMGQVISMHDRGGYGSQVSGKFFLTVDALSQKGKKDKFHLTAIEKKDRI